MKTVIRFTASETSDESTDDDERRKMSMPYWEKEQKVARRAELWRS